MPREVASSKPRDGQKPVNDAVNAYIKKARDAAIVESWKKSPGDVEKALVAVWKAFTFPLKNKSIAAVELALEADKGIAPELNFGELTEKERVAHPVYAASARRTAAWPARGQRCLAAAGCSPGGRRRPE